MLLPEGTNVPPVRDSIVASISACHADDPGSIPGLGGLPFLTFGARMQLLRLIQSIRLRHLARKFVVTVSFGRRRTSLAFYLAPPRRASLAE